MSNIVAFRPAAGRPRTEGPPGLSGAEILFFTGVRYERMLSDAPTDAALARLRKPSAAKAAAKAVAKNVKKETGRGRKRRA